MLALLDGVRVAHQRGAARVPYRSPPRAAGVGRAAGGTRHRGPGAPARRGEPRRRGDYAVCGGRHHPAGRGRPDAAVVVTCRSGTLLRPHRSGRGHGHGWLLRAHRSHRARHPRHRRLPAAPGRGADPAGAAGSPRRGPGKETAPGGGNPGGGGGAAPGRDGR